MKQKYMKPSTPPDEYETRVLTWWMLKNIKKEDLNNKKNYKKSKEGYYGFSQKKKAA